MKYTCLLLLLTILSLSCKNKEQVDQDIIPKKDLIELLIDLHIADAAANLSAVRRQFGPLDSGYLYNAVFVTHGYTKDDMIRSINHYTAKPREMRQIFDEVYSQLSAQAENAQDLYSKTSLSTTYRVWKAEKSKYATVGDTINYPMPFDVPVDTTGKFVLSVEINARVNDESINPRMVAYFYNPLNDIPKNRIYFDTLYINKSSYTRPHALIKENLNPDLNRLKIIIPDIDNNDSIFYKSFVFINLRLSLMHE